MSDNAAKLLHAIIRARTPEIPPWAALGEDERDDYRNVASLIAGAAQ